MKYYLLVLPLLLTGCGFDATVASFPPSDSKSEIEAKASKVAARLQRQFDYYDEYGKLQTDVIVFVKDCANRGKDDGWNANHCESRRAALLKRTEKLKAELAELMKEQP